MEAVYLPIRALGDFIITASVIKNYNFEKIPVVLPPYLNDIFKAIEGDKYFTVIDDIKFANQPAFFEMYKVKDRKNISRLVKELAVAFRSLNKRNIYLLDYRSKRLLFTGAKLKWPNIHENNYRGKYELFSKYFLHNTKQEASSAIKSDSGYSKVLIIPDSRIKVKSINEGLIDKIIAKFPNRINLALFGAAPAAVKPGVLFYTNFDQLIALVNEYDLIITAESLPYHLANYYNKPHFVIYNDTRHFKETFMTPFMIDNNYFFNFTGNNAQAVIEKLQTIIS
ncbi:MAG: hypothetical protein EOP47_21440 [Sphingobacteriaceae bacterium]|nr:MAG: hypothetical protein EOP47_21440 [Sphingobacteriaceae bacterium]